MTILRSTVVYGALAASAAILSACGSSNPDLADESYLGAPPACPDPAGVKRLNTEDVSIHSGIVLDDSYAYFVDGASNGGAAVQLKVDRVAKTGGSVQTLATFTSTNLWPDVAIDATYAYYIDQGGEKNHDTIYRVAKDGQGAPTKVIDLDSVETISIDGTSLYAFSDASNVEGDKSRLVKIDLESLAATDLWSDVGFYLPPDDLVTDDQYVYWQRSHDLVRTPKAGGTTEVVVTNDFTTPGHIIVAPATVDGNWLYYQSGFLTDQTGIWRIAKDGSADPTFVTDLVYLNHRTNVAQGDDLYLQQSGVQLLTMSTGQKTQLPLCPGVEDVGSDATSLYYSKGQLYSYPR